MKKTYRILKLLFFINAIVFLNMSQGSLAATDDGGQQAQSTQSEDNELWTEKMDRYHEKANEILLSSAKWIDSFFIDDNYTDEVNKTYLRTRFSTFFEEGESAESNFSYKLRLKLPGAEKRFALSVGSDDDLLDGFEDTPNSIARDRLEEVEDDTNVALEFFGWDTDKHNLKFSGGIRIRSGSAVGYGSSRYRYRTEIDDWKVRFTERVRWYEDDGWDSRSRVDFEQPWDENLFFRTTPGLDWYERRDGFYYSLTNSVYQLLDEDAAIQYELNNFFYTEVSGQHEETNIRIRFRRRIYKDWLVLEISPQLAWYEERDYDTVPGLFIRLETWFGNFSEGKIFDF
ncbi:MAG: hypothetical protein ACYTEM_07890 [Planctomycetota bacterium]|jgi:hypothetical protein